jgi:hypothetical protein
MSQAMLTTQNLVGALALRCATMVEIGRRVLSRSVHVPCLAAVWVLLSASVGAGQSTPLATAQASQCGDADQSGQVNVADGVQVLRSAAGLASGCTIDECDMDGNGTVTVSDGVLTLRKSAGLPVEERCPAAAGGPNQLCPTTKFTETCALARPSEFSAAGGQIYLEETGIQETTQSLSVSLDGFPTAQYFLSLLLTYGFNGNEILPRSDGTILMESTDGLPAATLCPGANGEFQRVIRTVRKRLAVCRVCDVGDAVLGAFEGVFQVNDGSECTIRGEFRAFRTE